MASKQQTLKSEVSLSGIGLHTGQTATITICPAKENSGYQFQRIDLEGEPIIKADPDNVISTKRGTTLGKKDAEVHTTEHLLAAIYCSKIDNALIKIDGPEVPILDGSSRLFLEAIEKAGIEEQSAERIYLELKENLTFEDESGVEMLAVPTEGGEFRLTVMVDYRSPVLGTQHAHMYHIGEFKEEISRCRTFVFLKEVVALAEAGLIKGGDLDNAVVLVEREYEADEIAKIKKLLGKEDVNIEVKPGVLNPNNLHFPNEPARHKLLDIVGDLALNGRFIRGHILAARPGHAGNVAFAKLLKDLIRKEQSGYMHFDLSKEPLFDINDISKMLPHRYPFLLVDKVMEMDETSIVGVKNVTLNEPFFMGHFPDNPVMPGVLQIEAMAQVGGIFALNQVEDPHLYSTYFLKIDEVRYKKKVLPGDTIVFKLQLESPIRRGLVNMRGKAYVNGQVVSEGVMLAQLAKDREA